MTVYVSLHVISVLLSYSVFPSQGEKKGKVVPVLN
jgi:hypothetical protein